SSFLVSTSSTETKPDGGLVEPPATATRFPSAVTATPNTSALTPESGAGLGAKRMGGPSAPGPVAALTGSDFGSSGLCGRSPTSPAAATTASNTSVSLMGSPRNPFADRARETPRRNTFQRPHPIAGSAFSDDIAWSGAGRPSGTPTGGPQRLFLLAPAPERGDVRSVPLVPVGLQLLHLLRVLRAQVGLLADVVGEVVQLHG